MNFLLAFGVLALVISLKAKSHKQKDSNMLKPLSQQVRCACGKVTLAVESPSALRLVCYCKDCRGYVNTLHENAASDHKQHAYPGTLDHWGGVDYTQIYPSEIKVVQGQEYLKTTLIRNGSPIRRVYASCCNTPMFSVGSSAALLNTNLVDDDKKPEVRFRIIGRDALKGSADVESDRPSISWSVPLGWFWTMIGRVDKKKMEPTPIDISKPDILDNFKQG